MGKASRRKRERKIELKRFESLAIPEADAKCGRKYDKRRAVFSKCPTCEWNLVLHCADCKIQVTGCYCTAIDRMSPEELDELKRQIEEKKAREAGLYIPKGL